MVDIARASKLSIVRFPYNAGAFYGGAAGLALGVGLVFSGINYPLFDEHEKLFDTVSGAVYVLTHECDLDATNERAFNEYALICPIICFREFALEFANTHSEGALFGFIPDLAANRIFRAIFVPPISRDVLPFGGILYLNQISSTHVSAFKDGEAKAICAFSTYAQRIIDYKLANHLLRPKADQLPMLH